jgi:DNA-binding MarR family transcriptional regulator
MYVHLMQEHLIRAHLMREHARVAAVTDTAEVELVRRWHELLDRHARVSVALEAELQQRHGLGVSEFEALDRLADAEPGKCRGAELTEAVHLSQSAASRLVARMERDGLVERSLCEVDRRGIFVVLTERGRQRHAEAKPTHRAVLAAALG